MSLLDGLNDAQKAAVTHGEGPLMIVAGAGTGKTTVITKRIAWLIETGRAKQDEILALTFTDKAAGEMEERVDKLLPIGYLDLWISTFHGFCERVLRAHGMDIGLPHGFTLVTDVDAWMLVRRNIDRFNLDYYKPRGNPTKFIQAMLDHFSRAKDEGLTPDAYAEKVTAMHADAEGADVLAHGVDATDEAALERKKMARACRRLSHVSRAPARTQRARLWRFDCLHRRTVSYETECAQGVHGPFCVRCGRRVSRTRIARSMHWCVCFPSHAET